MRSTESCASPMERPWFWPACAPPPENGRANDALCALLAAKLGARPSRVALAAGAKSRLKQVAVSGDPEALLARLRTL